MDNGKLAKDTATDFTRRALDLADEIGEDLAAIHLQAALDILTDAPIPRTIEEAEAMLQSPEAQAIMAQWQGKGKLTENIERDGAAAIAANLLNAHGDRALGHARVRLFAALHRKDTTEFQKLTRVCQLLMFESRPLN
jgi:hypothetical protein